MTPVNPIMTRAWHWPSAHTFSMKPVRELISDYIHEGFWIDPFVRDSHFKNLCTATNDLNPDILATRNMDALDFLNSLEGRRFDGVLFDPPFSYRQIKECYNGIGRKVHQQDTQLSFYGDRKRAAGKLIKIGGRAICCGWNSGGFGKVNGFELERVLLVAHGGNRNDTIVTVERKVTEVRSVLNNF